MPGFAASNGIFGSRSMRVTRLVDGPGFKERSTDGRRVDFSSSSAKGPLA